jgi:decaprenyl-phosphate phosphoribosyltransferase
MGVSETQLTVPPSASVQAPAVERADAADRVGTPEDRAAGAAPSVAAPRRGPLRAAVVTLRPKQWIKNLLVIAAPVAAGALGHDDVPVRVGLAFVAFCLLASGIYAINDVRDAAEDRLHPRKRFRPVAAGELSPEAATALGVALMVAGIALCFAIRPLLAAVGAGYVALSLSYTMVWRHLLVFDIFAIAGGFVLRAIAGGVAAPVTLSRWFILVVTAVAVFVAAGKRHAELRRTVVSNALVGRRKVLEGYTELRLRVILVVAAVVAVIAYAVWAFQLPAVQGVPWRPLTIVPFAAGLLRYGALIAAGKGESPEELLLRDRLLQLAGLAWLALFALGVNAAT